MGRQGLGRTAQEAARGQWGGARPGPLCPLQGLGGVGSVCAGTGWAAASTACGGRDPMAAPVQRPGRGRPAARTAPNLRTRTPARACQFRNASEHAAATSLSLHCGLSHRSGYFVGNLSPDVAVPLPRADCFLPPSTQVNQQESATTSITKRPWLSSRMGFCKILPIYHVLGLNSASHR